MRRFCSLAVAAFLLPLAARADVLPTHEATSTNPLVVGKALWNALGGDDGWNHARYLRFDWIVEREASASSCARTIGIASPAAIASTASTGGKPYSVYFNVNTRAGELVSRRQEDHRLRAGQEVGQRWLRSVHQRQLLAARAVQDLRSRRLADHGGEDKGPKGEPCDVIKLTSPASG